MDCLRIAVLLIPLFVSTHAQADDEKRTKKQAQAVSKEVYDSLMRVQDAIEYLASIGISPEDIEPNNLQFSSESFEDCTSQAEEALETKEELAIASVSCLKRHATNWRSDESE